MGFEIYAKRGIKNIYYHYFLFFVIFSKSFKQKLIIPIESCFLDGKKPNIAKLVNMNFSADKVKNQPGYSLCKNSSLNGFFLQIQ